MTDAELDAIEARSRDAMGIDADTAALLAALREARGVLREIAAQDLTEIALDPDWPRRVAASALEVGP